jgi:hypothetical protein
VSLYRDNARPPTLPVPAPELPRPIIQLPDAPEPWSFKTREHFPELMTRWGLTGVGVEVGVYRGGFSNLILREWPGVLHVVDPWEFQPDKRDMLNTPDLPSDYERATTQLQDWIAQGRCIVHRGYSVDVAASSAFCHRSDEWHALDWVYVDALHDYASCIADLTAWAPLIRPGGALCGHDYLDHPPGGQTDFGVVSAVRDWCKANDYSVSDDVLTTTHDGYPTYVIRLRP